LGISYNAPVAANITSGGKAPFPEEKAAPAENIAFVPLKKERNHKQSIIPVKAKVMCRRLVDISKF
jgi:hypothetical protein